MVTTTNPALLPRKCSLCDSDRSEVTFPTLLAADIEKRWDNLLKRERSVLAVSSMVISAVNAVNPQNVE